MTKLLHLSDLHFGAEDPDAVEALASAVRDLQPDGIVIGGDFTMRARRREWQAARHFLERLVPPVLAIPGNHDIPGFNQLWHRLLHPFRRYRHAIDEDLEANLIFGDIEVVGLNTARRFGSRHLDWSTGSVNLAQCLALPSRFQGKTPLRAVVIHHPLLAPPGQKRSLLKRDGLLLAALEKAKVDLLLAGHFHQSHTGLLALPLGKRDIVLSHVSTACSVRTKGEPMGFHLIEGGDSDLALERWDFDDDEKRFVRKAREKFQHTRQSWSQLT